MADSLRDAERNFPAEWVKEAIRMAVENLRVMGRATQGVKLINIKDGDSIAAVAKVVHEEGHDEQVDQIDEIESNNQTE